MQLNFYKRLVLFQKSFSGSVFTVFDRTLNSKIPKEPHQTTIKEKLLENIHEVDLATISHLERLSLVNFGNIKGVEILESSIKFAEPLLSVNTDGVKELTTVLEKQILPLRDDIVNEGNCRQAVMANANVTEEEYFVAPPGNIPLEPKNQEIFQERVKAGK